MIKVVNYSNKYQKMWSEFVESCPNANIGHQIGWQSVMTESFGRDSRYLMAVESNEALGILPLIRIKTLWGAKAYISIPWIDYGGICANDKVVEEMLYAKAREIAEQEKVKFMEFRSISAGENNFKKRDDKVTFLLDLSVGLDSIWKGFNAKLRNQIRKSDKMGLYTEYGGIERLNEFYSVFSRNMRDLGTPVWGKKCFESVLNVFKDTSRLILVKRDNVTVAGGVVLTFKDRVYIPWASAIRDYLKYCPNHSLYWRVIRDSIEDGFKYFDFGRSTIDCNTYRFKKQWVPNPTQLTWQYYLRRSNEIPNINPSNPKFKILVWLWKKLPLPIANRLGPFVNEMLP